MNLLENIQSGSLASHILGYIRKIDADQLKEKGEQGYTLNDLLPGEFKIPEHGYLSFNQLIDIYTNNISCKIYNQL